MTTASDPFSYPDPYMFHNLDAIVVFCSIKFIKHKIKKIKLPPYLEKLKSVDAKRVIFGLNNVLFEFQNVVLFR